MSRNLFNKINPLAAICSGLLLIPSTIAGLLVGFVFSLNTGVILSIISALSATSLSYILYARVKPTEENFFKHLSLVLSSVLGFLWGGMSIGPILFMYGMSVLTTGSALLIGGIGLSLFLIVNRFCKLVFGLKEINSVNIQAFEMIGMALAGCIGLLWGPLAWIVCSSLGLLLGGLVGIVSNFITKFNNTSKVLSALFGIAGTLIGVMLGAVVGALIPIISPIMISLFFGTAFMLIGSVAGIISGKFYPRFDLQDSNVQHRLYQAVSLLVMVFYGYLAGGLLGFTFFPINSILISQALGMIVASGFYGMVNAGYYMLKNIFARDHNPRLDSLQKLDQDKLQNVVEQAHQQDPQMVKDVVKQLFRNHPELTQGKPPSVVSLETGKCRQARPIDDNLAQSNFARSFRH